MTRSNVTQRLALAVKAATSTHAQLAKRSISPHTMRHTTAMHLLQSGVDISVIALWLGHESPTTTHQYVEADLRDEGAGPGETTGTRRRDQALQGTRLVGRVPEDPCNYVQAAGIEHRLCARAMPRPAPQLFITGNYA
jgi:integrase